MEAGAGVNHEQKLTEKQVTSLNKIFGENADFQKKENSFTVSLTLADGIAEGGQKIELELSDIQSITKVDGGMAIEVFKVNGFTINGVDITPDLGQIYFEIRNDKGKPVYSTRSQEQVSNEKNDNPIRSHQIEQHGSISYKSQTRGDCIFTPTFKNADDLVVILHEDGHLNDPDIFSENYLGIKEIYSINNWFIKEDDSDMDEKSSLKYWKYILSHEVKAHRDGIDKVKKLESKVKIFKADSQNEFVRLKKSMEILMLSYINAASGWYKARISARDLSELTNLN